MSLHAIIYLISLTERDSVDSNKLFLFLEALPWQNELKKAVLIPVFSKYDNLVFDSPDEEV